MNRVKKLREREGLTQAQLANFIGVDAATISRYENGGAVSEIDKIKLSDLFDVQIGYITDGRVSYLEEVASVVPVPPKEYERLKQIEEKYERVKQSLAGSDYNLIKLDNGLLINGARVNHLIDCKIDSSVDNLTEVTIKFIAKVDGLDNIDVDRHSYSDKE